MYTFFKVFFNLEWILSWYGWLAVAYRKQSVADVGNDSFKKDGSPARLGHTLDCWRHSWQIGWCESTSCTSIAHMRLSVVRRHYALSPTRLLKGLEMKLQLACPQNSSFCHGKDSTRDLEDPHLGTFLFSVMIRRWFIRSRILLPVSRIRSSEYSILHSECCTF